MNLTKQKKKEGFTLIELMAVIAIIAILAAVLVPTVTGYINRSKKTAVVTQARTVVNAIEAYNATSSDPLIVEFDSSLKIKPSGATDPLVSSLPDIVGEDILDEKAIEKLGNMTLATAKAINEDVDAIKNIKVYPNGVFGQYKTIKAAAPTNTDGEDGSNTLPVYTDSDLK